MNRPLTRTFGPIAVMVAVFALGISTSYGQAVSGELTGSVTDQTGAAVTGATVEVTNTATGLTTSTTTKSQGSYHFVELPVGTYTLTVKAAGFKSASVNVPVVLNKTGTANVQLEVGTSSTTVEVSAATAPVDTSSAQLQSNYAARLSEDLGITSAGGAGAGVLNLSLLSPGVTNADAMGDGMGPSVGGQRPRDNNFTVEGVDNNNKTVTGALVTVPNDAVQDFSLLENQFNAEFGHSSGGQFNTTVKSGTNRFHGSVYEYFRNRNLNAVDQTYVNEGLTSNPRYDSNRYGATLGGPIIKNKLFFFTDYERQGLAITSAPPGAVDAPTAAGLAAIGTDPNLSATNFGIFKQYVPVASAGTGCIPYNLNSFNAPANGICAAGSVETGPVTIAPPSWTNYTNFVQSVDFNLSEKDQIRGRFVYNRQDGLDNAAELPIFFTTIPQRFDLFTLGEYHTFSPSLLNEFRIGFNRFSQTFGVGNFNYPGLSAFPNILLLDLGSGLNIGPDPNAPQFTIQNFYNAVDNVTLTKGKHSFKLGVEFRDYISPQQFTQRSRGDYEYNETQLFLEDFSPDFFGQRSTGNVTYYGNETAIYWYATDTWRVTPHFTASLGIRYEYTTTPESENRQSLNAESSQPNLIIPQVNQPLVFSNPQAPKNNWAPRVGLAYSPGSSGNTSIRAGFGMAYDTLYDNIGILAVPPQVGSTLSVVPTKITPGFLAGGGLQGGGSGFTTFPDAAHAIAATSNWIPPNIKDPYSVNWNLGVQRAFGKYTAEINYVGTRGNHLSFQDIINLVAPVTASNALPTFLSMPSQAVIDGLTNNLNNLENLSFFYSPLNTAGFNNNVLTAFIPAGWSTYNGLETQLTRRFTNGLQFQAAYTWSHTIDNSTADFHTSDLTPRRPEDFFNFNQDKATSALSRANRFTLAVVYDLPYFKAGNWFVKNVVGNWQFSPIYTYESPEYVTVQSGVDSNLNLDSAGDRAVFNPTGVPGTGSGVTALCTSALPAGTSCDPLNLNSWQYLVGYAATNSSAQYIVAGPGAHANSSRNTLPTVPTNDFDLAAYKDLNFTERLRFRFGAQFANLLNHPQYIPGSNPGQGLGVNDVGGFSSVGGSYKSFVTPGNANFNVPKNVFASNARTIALVGKIIF